MNILHDNIVFFKIALGLENSYLAHQCANSEAQIRQFWVLELKKTKNSWTSLDRSAGDSSSCQSTTARCATVAHLSVCLSVCHLDTCINIWTIYYTFVRLKWLFSLLIVWTVCQLLSYLCQESLVFDRLHLFNSVKILYLESYWRH